MNQEQTPTEAPPKKGSNTALIIVIIIVVLALAGWRGYLYIKAINEVKTGVESSLVTTQQKATEVKIKSAVSTLGNNADQYFNQNNSYVGWKGNDTINQNIKSLGSQVVYQVTTQDSYMIYAKLPYSAKFFCFENTPTKGGGSVVSQITVDMKTCPPNETSANN